MAAAALVALAPAVVPAAGEEESEGVAEEEEASDATAAGPTPRQGVFPLLSCTVS